MEALEESIRAFLTPDSYTPVEDHEEIRGGGFGCGSGFGSGEGDGDGDGDGAGRGYAGGRGDGSGIGSGPGHDDGSGCCYSFFGGVKYFCGSTVYYVDRIPTIFYSVHSRFSRAAIIRTNLTLEDCYVARSGDHWAHGETLKKALEAAEAKRLERMPLQERISAFIQSHPGVDTPYGDLFAWHHTLTGSCEMGRKAWCMEHGLHPDDSITIRQFLTLTKDNYGGGVIRAVAEKMRVNLD